MALHVRWTGGKLVVLEVGPYLKVLKGGVVEYELEVAGRCPCHVELHDEDGCFNDEGDQFCEIYLQTRPPKWLVFHVTFITEANRFPELSITLHDSMYIQPACVIHDTSENDSKKASDLVVLDPFSWISFKAVSLNVA
jgi:hypothetical protein